MLIFSLQRLTLNTQCGQGISWFLREAVARSCSLHGLLTLMHTCAHIGQALSRMNNKRDKQTAWNTCSCETCANGKARLGCNKEKKVQVMAFHVTEDKLCCIWCYDLDTRLLSFSHLFQSLFKSLYFPPLFVNLCKVEPLRLWRDGGRSSCGEMEPDEPIRWIKMS